MQDIVVITLGNTRVNKGNAVLCTFLALISFNQNTDCESDYQLITNEKK